MRHQVDGRKFGRNTSHRVAMFRNMANSVIAKEQVVTTVQKAKEVRRVVDRLITLGKSGSAPSRRLAFDRTRDDVVVKKLFGELAERYQKRPGGYTRVLKMADRRWGDGAEMAVIELVDHPVLDRKRKPKVVQEAQSGGEVAEGKVRDTFKKFRGLFNPKGQHAPKGAAGRSMPKGGGAARRTPAAGGGGSKAGGSSS